MNYINKLQIENKGLEVVNQELKKKVNDLEIYLAMARGGRDYSEKLLYATQKEKNKLQNKLAETEKQIKMLEKAVNSLTKENEKLKEENTTVNRQETLSLNTQTTNVDLQEVVLNGLSFLTKAMQYNQNSLQRN